MADPLPPDHGMHSLEAKYAWALAEIARLRLALSAMTQAKEKVEGHAIHGWSEEAHQRGHKEDYIAMLEKAESALAQLRQGVQAFADEMSADEELMGLADRLRALLSPEAPS